MKKQQLFETDYVLYDRANDHVVRFEKTGDMVIYGEYNEALEDCRGNEEVIKCTDLPIHWKNELLKQTSKTLGCDNNAQAK